MPKNKDPAFMFYPADFLVGTYFMSHEEVGQYITLLCLQHQLGHLKEKDISEVCGDNPKIRAKFVQDEEGKYYNARLDAEIAKRAAFLEKQHTNGAKGGRPKKPKDNLMVNPNKTQIKPKQNPMVNPNETTRVENENDNENINKDIIHYLNSKLGTKYKASAEYVKKHINARLNEGYTLEDFKTVIDKKYKEWSGTEFAKFLRPETLFGTKFSTYLNQLGTEVQEARYTSFSADDALERALERAYEEF